MLVSWCHESEELTLSFLHRGIVLFIHSILVYCVRIDVIISVLRQRDKALPRFCIVAFRLSSKKIKTLTYSEYRVWGPRSLVAEFPSVVE